MARADTWLRLRCFKASAFLLVAAVGCGCGSDVPDPHPMVSVGDPPPSPLWAVGTTRVISWNSQLIDKVRIELLRGGAEPAELIADDVDASLGTYDWVVTGPPSAGNIIVITDTTDAEVSDESEPFDIVAAGIHVLGPAPGTYFIVGDDLEVTWLVDAATVAGVTDVRIEISRDNGGSWVEDIVASTGVGAGTYTWTVTDGGDALPQAECIVRVSDESVSVVNDETGPLAVFSGLCYVDLEASAGGDGLSWATAFRHPQDAMDVVPPGSEVWVAEGTYTRRDVGDTVLLSMANGVSVYGGFAGTESALGDRNWDDHPVILDGEDSCYHVVVAADDAAIDGLTVTRGLCDNSSDDQGGAGVYSDDCVFEILNCRFVDNNAPYNSGAAVLNRQGVMLIQNTIFMGNTAGDYGGAASSFHGLMTVDRCSYVGGSAGNDGGAIYGYSAQMTVTDTTFIGNEAFDGGAMCFDGATASLSNCVFSGNTASYRGGAIWDGNLSAFGGSCTVTNCTITGNAAGVAGDGGGGGGVLSYGSPALDITNCIIWGNTVGITPSPSQITVEDSGIVAVSYSDIEGGYAGSGNIDADPLFVDADGADNTVGTEDDDLRLQSGSPCIDVADGPVAPALDLDGNPRADDSAASNDGVGPPWADMGAYEYQP